MITTLAVWQFIGVECKSAARLYFEPLRWLVASLKQYLLTVLSRRYRRESIAARDHIRASHDKSVEELANYLPVSELGSDEEAIGQVSTVPGSPDKRRRVLYGEHPSSETLQRYIAGTASREESRDVIRHMLRQCAQCRTKLGALITEAKESDLKDAQSFDPTTEVLEGSIRLTDILRIIARPHNTSASPDPNRAPRGRRR